MPKKKPEPRQPEYARRLTLQEMAYGGETVARLTDQNFPAEPKPEFENQVVFVAGGLPGEVVDVQLYRRKKSYLRGNVIQLHQKSASRQEPPCPWFGIEKFPNCGGCQWQHADYTSQLAYKSNILRDQFVRIGGIADPPLLAPVAARSVWGYRNNVEFQVDRANGNPCFHRQNSIKLVPVQSCHIAHPLITLSIEPLTRALAKHLTGKVHQVTVRVGAISTDFPVSAEEITALASYSDNQAARLAALERFVAVAPLDSALDRPRPTLMFILRMLTPTDLSDFYADLNAALDRYAQVTVFAEGKKRRLDLYGELDHTVETLNGINYHIPPLAFFQSNSPMAEVLIDHAMQAFDTAKVTMRGANLLDLYCGVGTFSLQMAQLGANVLGVEEYEGAISAAEHNAKLNHLQGRTRFVAAKAEEYILQLEDSGQKFDGVLVDPPRRGCDPALLNSLLKNRPPVIVYVSCDPSTLARDVKILSETYTLVQSRVVDLFPNTYHMESVSLLQER
jgi:23S rRNA (uracil1939-C5)-methyltransferase